MKDEAMARVNVHGKSLHAHPDGRSILIVKERARCAIQGMPFSCIPISLIDGAAKENTLSLNDLPKKRAHPNIKAPSTLSQMLLKRISI